MTTTDDRWASGTAYQSYVGRWSRLVAPRFLDWLAVPPGRRWLDVGCGTGVLTAAILERCEPVSVVGVDPSATFIEHARGTVRDERARFIVGSAAATGLADGEVDAAVAGLVLNFVPDVPAALAELTRVVRPGGRVGGYVWDYAGGMEMMRRFWDAVVALDPSAASLDEASRFPIATEAGLGAAFRAAGLEDVEVRAIDIPTVFADFDDLWQPFLSGTAPGPAYVASLDEDRRSALRDRLRASVSASSDGSIRLVARAWAVKATRPA